MNIVPFQNTDLGFSVRTVTIDEEPWFVGKDVCAALGYANETDAMNRHCRGVVKRYPIVDGLGRTQEARIINEPDMMRLICGSKLESAQRFEAWVFEEVLPSIRRHGMYATDQLLENPDLAIKAFTALKEERERRKALEAQAEENAPYIIYGKSVEVAKGSKKVGTYAKILTQGGMIIGERRLFALLRELGILGKVGAYHNEPSQYCIERGYFQITHREITHASGIKEPKITPYLTPRGRIWLTNKFYKLWNTTPEVFTPFVGKGSCLRPDMKDYITHADVED
nr:MAG TPA: repressor domain protein [Bacteriophage sp.]